MEHLWLYILLIVIVIYLFFSFIVYLRIFRIDRSKKYKVVNQDDPFFQESYAWFQKVPKEQISIKSYDNVRLNGVFIPSIDETSTNMAIVVHGYEAFSEDMIIIAKLYSDLGFKVMLIDLRAHGASEGKLSSFGYYEKFDIKKWIQYSLRTYGSTDRILLHGVSMGAASIIQASGLNLPSNVRYIVADSGYSSLIKMLRNITTPKSLIIFFPGVSLITYIAHRFFIESIHPLKQIKKSKIPIMIIHGEDDEVVPFSMGKSLYDNSKSPYKEFYPVKDCLHGVGYIKDKEGIDFKLRQVLPNFFIIKKTFLKPKK